MPKAYSYIRFSTPQQSSGDSFRRQIEPSITYAKEHGLELDESLTFKDLGISGFDGSNVEKGALGLFKQAVVEGKVPRGSYLLVESLDRLSRQAPVDALDVLRSIIREGVTVVTLMDRMEYTHEGIQKDFQQLMYSLMIMSRAHEESVIKSKRVKASWDRHKQEGAKAKKSKMCPAWLKPSEDRETFEVIPEHQETINLIYEWYLGGFGDHVIVRKLNEEAIKPFSRSKYWTHSTVKKVLTSKQVIGCYEPAEVKEVTKLDGSLTKRNVPTGEVIEGYYPSVVSDEMFYKVQSLRTKRKKAGGEKSQNLYNLFKGILKCGYCGGSMIVYNVNTHNRTKGKYKYRILTCRDSKRGMGCIKINSDYDIFEENFLSYCTEIDLKELTAQSNQVDEVQSLYSAILKLEDQISTKEGQLQNLMDAIANAEAAPDILIQRISSESKALDELKVSLSRAKQDYEVLQNSTDTIEQTHQQMKDFIKEVKSMPEDLRYEIRVKLSAVINRLVKHVSVFQNGPLSQNQLHLYKNLEELAKLPVKDKRAKAFQYNVQFYDMPFPRVVRMDPDNLVNRLPDSDLYEPKGMEEFINQQIDHDFVSEKELEDLKERAGWS